MKNPKDSGFAQSCKLYYKMAYIGADVVLCSFDHEKFGRGWDVFDELEGQRVGVYFNERSAVLFARGYVEEKRRGGSCWLAHGPSARMTTE